MVLFDRHSKYIYIERECKKIYIYISELSIIYIYFFLPTFYNSERPGLFPCISKEETIQFGIQIQNLFY